VGDINAYIAVTCRLIELDNGAILTSFGPEVAQSQLSQQIVWKVESAITGGSSHVKSLSR
jgi:hypothetical protein